MWVKFSVGFRVIQSSNYESVQCYPYFTNGLIFYTFRSFWIEFGAGDIYEIYFE